MAIKAHDVIEVDYTARLADTGEVFDTTSAEVASKHHLHREGHDFAPAKICVGAGQWLPALDQAVLNRDVGALKVELAAEQAFGKKSAKLLEMMPKSSFEREDLKPIPGLEVTIDGRYGRIRTVSGGRVMVDFNHPLAGHALIYELEIRRVITDDGERARALAEYMGLQIRGVDAQKQELRLEVEQYEQVKTAEPAVQELIAKYTPYRKVKLAAPAKSAAKTVAAKPENTGAKTAQSGGKG